MLKSNLISLNSNINKNDHSSKSSPESRIKIKNNLYEDKSYLQTE